MELRDGSAALLAERDAGATRGTALAGPVVGVVAQALLIAAIAGTGAVGGVGLNGAGWIAGVTCGVMMNLALAAGLDRYGVERLSPADWVTLTRATVAVGVAALVAASFGERVPVAMVVSLASLALLLDAVDGWVARRTRTGALGARFDGEVDAFLILVLSVFVARSLSAWVLAIGVARYGFLAAGWRWSWMRAALPPRYWRKVVAALQGIVLTVAIAGVLSPAVTRVGLGVALAMLTESFGRDVWWLWRRRPVGHDRDLRPSEPGARHGLARAGTRAAVTGLALLIVWVALVAPDRPEALTLTGFLRVPLEGVVLIALALLVPRGPRRVLGALIGPALGLVLVLKVLDIGFLTTFARPFDPVGDLGNLGTGVETLRAALGHTEANLLIVGAVAVVVAVVGLTTASVLRLMRLAASHRRRSTQIVAALATVWLLCWAFGAQLLSQTPVASTATVSFGLHEVRTVQVDIRDEALFAQQIRHDPFRNTPGDRLLTGLRGKDVLLVFVESYGQVSVEGSAFAPAIDTLLRHGTSTLRTAGFSARSAFVNAPAFGGISWLGHSTLQSGVWANSQRRYNELVGTKRFTLTDAFNRAGWRTINFAPADDRDWPEGSSYYHYGKLYDRRNIGYRGPGFSYAPMPDQYMFSALQRLEIARTHRRPLFAEVDTVSSHMPWNRVPRIIPWREVGDGSIFRRVPVHREPDSFWWHPDEVKAAYARSLAYSLNTLISFVRHYGRKNLVLVVVGDEQPLPIVSGHTTSHEVPISVIARDPAVLRCIRGWGWNAGLLPRPHAPVWPMSAFRDRFLAAYGPGPSR